MIDPRRLDDIPVFAALAPEQRQTVAEMLDEVEVPAGERNVSQGDFSYEFFAIEEGTAQVEQAGAVIARLGPGEFFGELGLLVTGRRTAAIVAESPMRMLAMFDQNFRRLERQVPEFAEIVRTEMRSRFTRPATPSSA